MSLKSSSATSKADVGTEFNNHEEKHKLEKTKTTETTKIDIQDILHTQDFVDTKAASLHHTIKQKLVGLKDRFGWFKSY